MASSHLHDIGVGHKICDECGIDKALDQFNPDKRTRDKVAARCRQCLNAYKVSWATLRRAQRRATCHRYYVRNKEKLDQIKRDKRAESGWKPKRKNYHRERDLKDKYGLTGRELLKRIADQGGRCPICDAEISLEKPRGAAVDHNHATGRVRAILCHRCNSASGLFRDDPVLLMAAAEYFLKWSAAHELDQLGGSSL